MIKNVVLEYLLEPEYLDKNYKTTILSLFGDKYTGKSQKFGLIKSVDELKEIIRREIQGGNVRMSMLCECDIIKPTINLEVKCIVDMVHVNGIFVNFEDIRVLIPNTNHEFDVIDNKCRYKTIDINVGDTITVKIKNIRYDNSKFSCIGEIIF